MAPSNEQVTPTGQIHAGAVATPTLKPPDFTVVDLKISLATREDLGGLKYDLVFLASGKLMRLDHTAAMVKEWTMPDPMIEGTAEGSQAVGGGRMTQYWLDPLHHILVFLRSKGIVANGLEVYMLGLYDDQTGQTRLLLESTPEIKSLALSPDARWIAYNRPIDNSLMLISTSLRGAERQIADCSGGQDLCGRLDWSSDSSALVWSDAAGVWVYEIAGAQSRQVLSDTLEVKSLDGQLARAKVRFAEAKWSPLGRFLTVWVMPAGAAGTGWRGVVDTRIPRIVELPNSYAYQSWAASDVWTWDGRILALSAAQSSGIFPEIQIWRVFPTRGELLDLQATFQPDLTLELQPAPEQTQEVKPAVGQIAQVSQSVFSMRVTFPGGALPSELVRFDLRYGSLVSLAQIPAEVEDIRWAPDGANAILTTDHGAYLLVMNPEVGLLDLQQVLPEGAHTFSWLP